MGDRLDAVPPQHQKMRRKALRLLMRHTDAAIDELRDDEDEMLRGAGLMRSLMPWRADGTLPRFQRRAPLTHLTVQHPLREVKSREKGRVDF